MKVLGIETSCDETAAAVVKDGRQIISNIVHSQIDIHQVYGGVVPEIAARSHIEYINPIINQALSEAKLTWDDIDTIAVTFAPGLVGSLLIGTLAARTLAILKNKPLYPIHHLEAHIYANFLTAARPPRFPILALVVSGGHTQLIYLENHGQFQIIGSTCDDAIGEVFDKVAKILGLSYPGGPSIAKAALAGHRHKYQLPKAKLSGAYDFSFSGLKTAVLRAVQREVAKPIDFPSSRLPGLLNEPQRQDFAASFETVAIETLVDKLHQAYLDYRPSTVVIAGGVSANTYLRQQITKRLPIKVKFAPVALCTDNAAMVATAGYYHTLRTCPVDPYDLEIHPSLSLIQQ
jgi:N6-L-threonylcarbamoyladenine synthase